MTVNVCGVRVETRTGAAVRERAGKDVVILETLLDEKTAQVVDTILASDVSIAVRMDTHMSAAQIDLFDTHLQRVHGLACAGIAAEKRLREMGMVSQLLMDVDVDAL